MQGSGSERGIEKKIDRNRVYSKEKEKFADASDF